MNSMKWRDNARLMRNCMHCNFSWFWFFVVNNSSNVGYNSFLFPHTYMLVPSVGRRWRGGDWTNETHLRPFKVGWFGGECQKRMEEKF